MVIVNHVSKCFRTQTVLNDFSVVFKPDEIAGSKNSETIVHLKCIIGATNHVKNGLIIGEGAGFVQAEDFIISRPGFNDNMSGFRNLARMSLCKDPVDSRTIERCMRIVGLKAANRRRVGDYTPNMKARLALAQSFIENPSVLMLDDLSIELYGEEPVEVRAILDELRSSGRTICITRNN